MKSSPEPKSLQNSLLRTLSTSASVIAIGSVIFKSVSFIRFGQFYPSLFLFERTEAGMCLADWDDTLTEKPNYALQRCGLAQIFHFIRRCYFCITGQAYIPGCWAGQFKFPLILYYSIFNYQFWKIVWSCNFFSIFFWHSLLFLRHCTFTLWDTIFIHVSTYISTMQGQ